MKKTVLILSVLLLITINPVAVLAQKTDPSIGASSYSGTIKVGENFTHKIEVKLLTPVIIEFKLLKGPEGMQLDTRLGIVTWIPTTKGEFIAEIGIYTGTTKVGSSILKLKVVDFLGTISGTVTNDEGKALVNVIIIINKKVVTTGRPDSYLPVAKSFTDVNGKYTSSNLESGIYFIYAETGMKISTTNGVWQSYLPVWYVNSPTFETATGVPIDQANPKFEANLTMHLNPNSLVTTYAYAFTIQKNQPFTYQISIPLPANILPTEFKLLKPLSTLSVDKDNGKVTWTPTETGEFSTEIGVYNNNNKFASVVIKFRVTGFLGSVKGNVKGDDGLLLKGVMITLYKKYSVAQKNETYQTLLSALTDDKGNYLIEKVKAGSYFVHARTAFEKIVPPMPPPAVNYSPVWYKDSPTMDKADLIEISELNKSVEASLTMHKYVKQEPITFSISGKVLSGSTPIVNAVVLASMSGKITTGSANSSDVMGLMSVTDPTLGVFTDIISKAVTDRDGNYKLQVRGSASYIISCYAEGYQLQYFNGKGNVLDADKLTPDKDLTGINFNLTSMPPANGRISGKITNELQVIVKGKAILYSANSTIPMNLISRTVNTNDLGEFTFEKVQNGKYYLQVIPSKEYMPAYYKSNECGIRDPKQSDLIVIENDGTKTGILVCVKKVTTTGGGKISGSITDANGTGISGVIVTAETKDLDQCSFSITENNGSYEILDLGVGDYSLTGEKFGYTSITRDGAIIDYAKNSFSSTVNFIMNNANVTSVEQTNEIPAQFSLEQNYPNPFNPTTVIRWRLAVSSFVNLKIYDLLGQEVATLVDEFQQAGIHHSQFSILNYSLSSGVYFYTLIAGNNIETKKMNLIK